MAKPVSVSQLPVGAWLRAQRNRQDEYSQETAAHKIGVSYKTLRRWELGQAIPPTDKFFALAVLYQAVAELPSIVAKWERATARDAAGRRAG